MQQVGPVIARHGLSHHGLRRIRTAFWNLSTPALYEEAMRRGEGLVGQGGAFVVETGHHTGRSPNDKFIVEEETSKHDIWWGSVNRPISEERFDVLLEHVLGHLEGRDVFVQDCYAGADPAYRLKVRVITEGAWTSLFAHNILIRPAAEEREHFTPDFTILQAPTCQADPQRHGTRSETFILANLKRHLVV
ncbi:MAG: phosphoenolpyruvate carboxykinase (ATP), partial [Alphaproteobacteria bacterium]